MANSNATPPAPTTTGFQLFLASGHPSRPQTVGLCGGRSDVAEFSGECLQVYKTLPDREVFALQAKKVNAECHTAKATSPLDRHVWGSVCLWLSGRSMLTDIAQEIGRVSAVLQEDLQSTGKQSWMGGVVPCWQYRRAWEHCGDTVSCTPLCSGLDIHTCCQQRDCCTGTRDIQAICCKAHWLLCQPPSDHLQ